jgi:hypothetical protein
MGLISGVFVFVFNTTWKNVWKYWSRKLKARKCNDQNKNDERTNKDIQNATQKSKDWTINAPLVNRRRAIHVPLVKPVVLQDC